LSDDFVYHTYAPWSPGGRSTDREGLIAAARAGASYYPDRKSTVLTTIASGNTVFVETEWSGTASDKHPTLEAGERETMRELSIYRFRDGKIIELRYYVLVLPAQQ
jgi:ketosteroid isomerase-like protein